MKSLHPLDNKPATNAQPEPPITKESVLLEMLADTSGSLAYRIADKPHKERREAVDTYLVIAEHIIEKLKGE